MHSSVKPSLITVQDAADMLSVSRWTVYRLIWDNLVQSVQIGRSRRIVKESLDAYVRGLIEGIA
jgi:excisionase family DNA binding protein